MQAAGEIKNPGKCGACMEGKLEQEFVQADSMNMLPEDVRHLPLCQNCFDNRDNLAACCGLVKKISVVDRLRETNGRWLASGKNSAVIFGLGGVRGAYADPGDARFVGKYGF